MFCVCHIELSRLPAAFTLFSYVIVVSVDCLFHLRPDARRLLLLEEGDDDDDDEGDVSVTDVSSGVWTEELELLNNRWQSTHT